MQEAEVFKIRIKMSEQTVAHQRSIYNALDWLGDIGGLLDGLTTIGSFVVAIYSFILGDPLDSYLLQSLFKTENKNQS